MCIRDRLQIDRIKGGFFGWLTKNYNANVGIDQMVRDAESHADEDRQRKAEAEVRNNADNLVYQTEKLLADQGDQLTEDETTNVTGKLEDLKKALVDDDVEVIRMATEELMAASQEFGQRLYEAAQAESAAAGGGSEGGSDDDVVDAEIVDES